MYLFKVRVDFRKVALAQVPDLLLLFVIHGPSPIFEEVLVEDLLCRVIMAQHFAIEGCTFLGLFTQDYFFAYKKSQALIMYLLLLQLTLSALVALQLVILFNHTILYDPYYQIYVSKGNFFNLINKFRNSPS